MGDILIHGMEMPNDGLWGTVSIPFYIHGNGSVSDSKGHIIGNAVYVPPHGKLVDVADVKELFEKHFGDDQIAFQLIDYVPVIIPPKSKEQQDQEDLVERLNREGIAP